MIKVTVISTGFSPPADAKRRCIDSIARQRGVEVEHLVHDAGEDPAESWAHFENLSAMMLSLPDDRIVASVDLDDHLLREDALSLVAKLHEAGAWVTYGSYRFLDGRAGYAAPCDAERCRSQPFTASHLKTFRAGLFKLIPRADLHFEGTWIPHARDLALMYPMMEMAGPKRVRFVKDVLYGYNLATSSEFTGGEEFRRHEARCVAYVRALARLSPVDSL